MCINFCWKKHCTLFTLYTLHYTLFCMEKCPMHISPHVLYCTGKNDLLKIELQDIDLGRILHYGYKFHSIKLIHVVLCVCKCK